MRIHLLALAAVCLLAGCTTYNGPYEPYIGPTQRHQVYFDNYTYSPDYTILKYRYSLNNKPIVEGDLLEHRGLTPFLQPRAMAEYPVGDALYVKWINRTTGKEFEQVVPLKPVLPLSVRDTQLLVVPAEGVLNLYLLGSPQGKYIPQECKQWLADSAQMPNDSELAVRANNCTSPLYKIYPTRHNITGLKFEAKPRSDSWWSME